ncbi:aromatic/alkene monooxygenase hydroxylase subunit beta [Thauera butanivorans]|uniref:Butane monooxygenase hydroxylase BMOH beta subunit n=1 Tax=Thauera butanivorans TaxID=86174 RepID=Q8KQE9_9RHOO|nr:aromatic/alkene monooxygenase hydroxylase subunit beta [Thauera butanivorans]AAM19728.1 butane monooxygenase hydroxylase BMOH beta subunit [Thauera butanivorans]
MSTNIFTRGMVDPERQACIQEVVPKAPLETKRDHIPFAKRGWRRLTEYEAVMLHAQNSLDAVPGSQEVGEVVQKWPGGRPNYGVESTAALSSNWFHFRDPSKRWFMPYVKQKNEEGQTAERAMKSWAEGGDAEMMNAAWREHILARHYGAFVYNEYGLFSAHSTTVYGGLSDLIKTWIAEAAFDKNDAGQMIQMQRVLLSKVFPGFDADLAEAKQAWTEDKSWKPAREFVEHIWAETYDWVEQLWAIHAVYDHIFGQFVRREFFQRLGGIHGDTLTPFIQNQALTYHLQARDGVTALCFKFLIEDEPVYAQHNRRYLRAWTGRYLPQVGRALKAFLAIYKEVPVKIDGVTCREGVRASVERVVDDWAARFAEPINFKFNRAAFIDDVLSGY